MRMESRSKCHIRRLKARLGPTVLQKAPLKVNTVTSLRELPQLGLPKPQISKIGSLYRARWPGRADCCYGVTREEAEHRLRTHRTF
jgi:hypothetical protein